MKINPSISHPLFNVVFLIIRKKKKKKIIFQSQSFFNLQEYRLRSDVFISALVNKSDCGWCKR